MKIAEERIAAALAALGNIEEEVVATLRAKGIRAIGPNELHGSLCETCPVAAYLTTELGAPQHSAWTGPRDSIVGDSARVPHQPAVNRFIDAYDEGKYPEFAYAPE